MKLAMIVRMDATGLGNQTRELAYMLRPDKLLIIDSTPFKSYAQQYPEWYKDFPVKHISKGFPTSREKRWLLDGIDAIFTCETPYGHDLIQEANRRGIKTFIQYNYEFLDNLQKRNTPLPTVLISPSSWGMEDVKKKLGVEPVLLRPPLDLGNFAKSREINRHTVGKRRFLHVVGIGAAHDRNGTETLIEAMKHTNADFELVIRAQYQDGGSEDSRIIFDSRSLDDNAELYAGFDALIMPRRYGGLCMVMNEALASGLPVIMTDIPPNRDLLPKAWRIKSKRVDKFMTRTMINVYSADPKELASTIDKFVKMPDEKLLKQKEKAFDIASREFSSEVLLQKYADVLEDDTCACLR